MRDGDQVILKNVNYFNNFDLYSKERLPDISDEIKEYYSELLDETPSPKFYNGRLFFITVSYTSQLLVLTILHY